MQEVSKFKVKPGGVRGAPFLRSHGGGRVPTLKRRLCAGKGCPDSELRVWRKGGMLYLEKGSGGERTSSRGLAGRRGSHFGKGGPGTEGGAGREAGSPGAGLGRGEGF